MKLIIQIPCYNEEKTLPITLKELPRQVPGFDKVEWLIVDDGSTDRTIEVAKEYGVDHIIKHPKNLGLARAFMTGLNECIKIGADIIVNTDADNQYCAKDIQKLVNPILKGKAEIVVGIRPISEIRHFSTMKKILQKFGSWIVRKFSKTNIEDVTSGFRAISREAAMKINVFNDYTYTLEMIIQAGQKNMAICSVPIRVNDEKLRPSRLMKNILSYLKHSVITIIRIFVVYRPFRFFFIIGSVLFVIGLLIGLRFLYFYFTGNGSGHMQSVVLSGVFLGMGFQTILVAFMADLLAVNRKLLEEVQYKLRLMKIEKIK